MPPAYPTLDLDLQLCFPLYAATRAVTRKYGELLAEVGLTYPQYLVMLALWGGSPKTVGELGHRLRLDSGTLTPLLKRLESAGYVVRRRDAADERRVLVEPTDAGWQLREKVAHVPEALAASMGLTAKDFGELGRILAELLRHVDGEEPVTARR
jgi:MarR family transcriptional regulator, organic hydroperoxide resistance regulator